MATSHSGAGNGEPSTSPQADRWYNLTLGSSFKDNSSTKFCTLRYEFKPASIDKSQPGSLHKNKENRISVEFRNNQPGKPKVTFEGSIEDHKENDGVLFFDGETFRLERLHRAVKRLRHVRQPGESAAAAVSSITPAGTGLESRSPPLAKMTKVQPPSRTIMHPVPVEVERIDIGEPDNPAIKPTGRSMDYLPVLPNSSHLSPDRKANEQEDDVDIDVDDDEVALNISNAGGQALAFDFNVGNQNEADDEIADVDVSEDEGDKGPNAAEALRAQVNAEEEQQQQTSSSSGSSGSGSSGSGSGSGSSSSDSDGSDDDSASSGGDVDI